MGITREERERRRALKRAYLESQRTYSDDDDEQYFEEGRSDVADRQLSLGFGQATSSLDFDVRTVHSRGSGALQRALVGSAKLLLIPFVVLNLAAGFVGGIWLIVIGQWRLTVGGFMASLAFPFAFTLVGLPGMGFAALSAFLLEKRQVVLGAFVGAASSLYSYALVTAWVVIVWSVSSALSTDLASLAPLLYGYSVATGPFGYMASKEPPDSTASTIVTFFAQVSYVSLAGSTLLGAVPLGVIAVVVLFILVLIAGFLFTLKLGWTAS